MDAETIVAGRRGDVPVAPRSARARRPTPGSTTGKAARPWPPPRAGSPRPRRSRTPEGGPTVNAGRFIAGDATFVDGLATAHDLLGTDRQLNVVPDRAIVEGEARFLRAIESDELARHLKALARDVAAATGTSLGFGVVGPYIPPVDPYGPQTAVTRRAVDLAAAQGWDLEIETERGGISFPNFLPDPSAHPRPRRPRPDRRRDAHPGGVRGAALARRRIVLLADLLAEDGSAV